MQSDDDNSNQGAGYMRVGVRVRPLGEGRGESSKDGLKIDAARGCITHKDQKYEFANIFDQGQDNSALFQTVGQQLVSAAIMGYNGTLFAYGQTGSGKTYTMGEASKINGEHEGVGHRMIRNLFACITADRHHTYSVQVSFVQVYVEKVYDLLGERQTQHGRAVDEVLQVREDKQDGVYVVGAKRLPATSASEALSHVRAGLPRARDCGMHAHSLTRHDAHPVHRQRASLR